MGTCLVIQWVKVHLAIQEMQIRSLVGKLRSHMPWKIKTLIYLPASLLINSWPILYSFCPIICLLSIPLPVILKPIFSSVQFSSVAQSCLTLCDPMNHSTPGLPVHHQLLESTQTHVHRVGDAIQPSHPLSSPSPAPNPSPHQGLFQWVNSSHEVARVLEFQLQHQSFQWTPRTDLL